MQMKSRANLIKNFLFIGLLLFSMGCNQAPLTQTSKASNQEEGSMSVAYKTDTDNRTIPPMDMAVPSIFETATFGLG